MNGKWLKGSERDYQEALTRYDEDDAYAQQWTSFFRLFELYTLQHCLHTITRACRFHKTEQ